MCIDGHTYIHMGLQMVGSRVLIVFFNKKNLEEEVDAVGRVEEVVTRALPPGHNYFGTGKYSWPGDYLWPGK